MAVFRRKLSESFGENVGLHVIVSSEWEGQRLTTEVRCVLPSLWLQFPEDYPSSAPHIQFLTTNGGKTRFNPNLYSDGKVCLSILGTWRGESGEQWSSVQNCQVHFPRPRCLFAQILLLFLLFLLPAASHGAANVRCYFLRPCAGGPRMLVQPAIRAGLEAAVHAAIERQVRQDEPVGPRVERDVERAGRHSRRLPTSAPLSSGGRESLERS